LISGRDYEQLLHNQIEALPLNQLSRPPAIRSNPRLNSRARCPECKIRAPSQASVDPLYLFACAVGWHRSREAGAGWELVRAMRSAEPEARIATALLAETKEWRLQAGQSYRGLAQPGPGEREQERHVSLAR
jgi:hypothetical protein